MHFSLRNEDPEGARLERDSLVGVFYGYLAKDGLADDLPALFTIDEVKIDGFASPCEDLLVHECGDILSADVPVVSGFSMLGRHGYVLNLFQECRVCFHWPREPFCSE